MESLLTLPEGIDSWQQAGIALEKMGAGFTMFEGQDAIACGGIALMHPGVGKAWAWITKYARQKPFHLTRSASHILYATSSILEVHRIECDVSEKEKNYQKWLELIQVTAEDGSTKVFEKEGILRQYGSDKSNFIKYSMVL